MLSVAFATTCTRESFDSFKTEFSKEYDTEAEDSRRFSIFCKNLARYERLNKESTGAVFGVTKFSDMSQAEFRKCYLGYRKNKDVVEPDPDTSSLKTLESDPPQTFDWRNRSGILTPVYNQEQCGSCWAFSATENIESQWALANHTLTELSMQQIVDCDKTDGGCNGGDTTTAYEYVIKAGGMDTLKSYPYTAQNGKCKFNKTGVVAKISKWEYTGKKNESKMIEYLISQGPVSICVDASNWDGYNGGIMKASQCGNQLDHCVLAVGYDMNQKYWIVRNSWGKNWGVEHGFIYLEYGKNTCGLSDEPTTSIV